MAPFQQMRQQYTKTAFQLAFPATAHIFQFLGEVFDIKLIEAFCSQ